MNVYWERSRRRGLREQRHRALLDAITHAADTDECDDAYEAAVRGGVDTMRISSACKAWEPPRSAS